MTDDYYKNCIKTYERFRLVEIGMVVSCFGYIPHTLIAAWADDCYWLALSAAVMAICGWINLKQLKDSNQRIRLNKVILAKFQEMNECLARYSTITEQEHRVDQYMASLREYINLK